MYYIGYYTTADDARVSSPAANAKIISISKALAKNNIPVKIISSCTVANKDGFVKGRKFNICKNVTCKQYSIFTPKIVFLQKFKSIFANIRLFFTLIFMVKKGENVLMYHDIERSKAVIPAKKIKNFRLILEVEEIYSNASKLTFKQTNIENKIIALADAFIFPTVLLNDKINKNNKPFAIIHGTYEAEKDYEVSFGDSKCHVVYAGTLGAVKGGAYAAVQSGEFLNDDYHIHILGFGSADDIQKINKLIDEINSKSKCKASYDGLLSGKDYINFIQSCDIGLSTQNPSSAFNDTSFPSKILSYMANGLKVVSVKIPVVVTSDVNDYMYYYEQQTPQQIAEAIKKANKDNFANHREVIKKLNAKFIKEIMNVIN